MSHKSKLPLKSTAAPEIFEVGEAINEVKNIMDPLCSILRISFKLTVVTDAEELYKQPII